MAGERWYPGRIFYYQCAHLKVHLNPAFIIDISDEFEKKYDSISSWQIKYRTA